MWWKCKRKRRGFSHKPAHIVSTLRNISERARWPIMKRHRKHQRKSQHMHRCAYVRDVKLGNRFNHSRMHVHIHNLHGYLRAFFVCVCVCLETLACALRTADNEAHAMRYAIAHSSLDSRDFLNVICKSAHCSDCSAFAQRAPANGKLNNVIYDGSEIRIRYLNTIVNT